MRDQCAQLLAESPNRILRKVWARLYDRKLCIQQLSECSPSEIQEIFSLVNSQSSTSLNERSPRELRTYTSEVLAYLEERYSVATDLASHLDAKEKPVLVKIARTARVLRELLDADRADGVDVQETKLFLYTAAFAITVKVPGTVTFFRCVVV